ncbi:MAG: hypothetical protein IKE30_05570 [Clostridia bacterium]|nr:hypothetical protein [Clostridia bacterium]
MDHFAERCRLPHQLADDDFVRQRGAFRMPGADGDAKIVQLGEISVAVPFDDFPFSAGSRCAKPVVFGVQSLRPEFGFAPNQNVFVFLFLRLQVQLSIASITRACFAQHVKADSAMPPEPVRAVTHESAPAAAGEACSAGVAANDPLHGSRSAVTIAIHLFFAIASILAFPGDANR